MEITAKELIKSLYDAINHRDIEAAMQWIDEDCIYQDLNFPQPFVGKKAVRELFEESIQGIPNDLQFVIDDITTDDRLAVGIVWHVELDGMPFPNGRGASFYRLSDKTHQLIFARDVVESPVKLGRIAFFIMRLVLPLVRRTLTSSIKV